MCGMRVFVLPALCTMTAGMLVFASLISNINNVINDGSLIKFEEKMQALDEFFKHRQLPIALLDRVREYHERMFEISHGAPSPHSPFPLSISSHSILVHSKR